MATPHSGPKPSHLTCTPTCPLLHAGNPPDGERKLYLLIEGPTEQAVRRAKQELKKTIEEITEKAMRRDVGAAGRYQI